MTTKQVCKAIDDKYTARLEELGMAFSLRKMPCVSQWRVNIGKFNASTDPYIESYIDNQHEKSLVDQFGDLLEEAAIDAQINYPERKEGSGV